MAGEVAASIAACADILASRAALNPASKIMVDSSRLPHNRRNVRDPDYHRKTAEASERAGRVAISESAGATLMVAVI